MAVTVLNTTASLSGKTLAKLEDAQTITGAKTFDLGASAPFICVAGSAKVTHLDADYLDGEDGADFHDAAQLTGAYAALDGSAITNLNAANLASGTAPTARLGSGAASVNTFLRGDSAWALASGFGPSGRLTLTSGTPVTTSDVTAAGTLYWALYKGNRMPLFTGTAWVWVTFTELSVAAPAAANQMYDAFVDYNDGTLQLTLTAWTNDTTRATALTTQDGMLVLTGDTQKLFVGSVRTVTASQFNDSYARRHVWNYYNRVQRALLVTDGTATWTYTTATVRQANGSTANQVSIVVGVAEVAIDLTLTVVAVNNGGNSISAGIGEGSTTTYASGTFTTGGTVTLPLTARLSKFPAVGYQFYSWNEWSTAAGTTTWYGTNTIGASTANGLRGSIWG